MHLMMISRDEEIRLLRISRLHSCERSHDFYCLPPASGLERITLTSISPLIGQTLWILASYWLMTHWHQWHGWLLADSSHNLVLTSVDPGPVSLSTLSTSQSPHTRISGISRNTHPIRALSCQRQQAKQSHRNTHPCPSSPDLEHFIKQIPPLRLSLSCQ